MKYRFLKSNFLIYLGTFTLPVLLLGAFFLVGIYKDERKKAQEDLANSMSLAVSLVSGYEADTDAFQLYVDSGERMAQYFRAFKIEKLDYDSVNALRYLYAYMTSLNNSRTDMASVYFYLNNDLKRVVTSERFIGSVTDMADSGWLDVLMDMKGNERTALVRRAGETGNEVFSVIHRFPNYKGGTVINYELGKQREKLEQMIAYEGQYLLIFDSGGELLFGNARTVPEEIEELARKTALLWGSGEKLPKNDFYLVDALREEDGRFIVVTAVPKRTVNYVFFTNMRTLILLLIVIAAASAFLSYDRANRNYRQLYRIIDLLDRAEKNMEPEGSAGNDENIYDHILQNIIRTFLNNSYLKLQLSERKYREMTAQMLALQYQINPHFLFNTLQALNYEILALSGGKQGNANYMVENLSDLLRYSLNTQEMDVSVKEEIEICKKYMDIQKMRTGQEFFVEWEVDAAAESCKIRRMLLQPLLENAFSHGIKGKKGGRIRIAVRRKENKVVFKVIDNGKGIPADRLEQLRLKMKETQVAFESEHIGLQNVNQRLLLAYGEEAGLHIQSKDGIGTIQYFYINYKEEEDGR